MAALVDTNILVYRYDPRDERKQTIATDLLRNGIADRSLRVAYQAIVEFYAAVTRPLAGHGALLDADEASRETEELLQQFSILYPDEDVVSVALHGARTLQLSWFDALMWAYAETNDLTEIVSEDFQHDRRYGRVRVVNPFR